MKYGNNNNSQLIKLDQQHEYPYLTGGQLVNEIEIELKRKHHLIYIYAHIQLSPSPFGIRTKHTKIKCEIYKQFIREFCATNQK